MSTKTKLKIEMRAASARAGGSHLTRQARDYFIGTFVTALFLLGFPIRTISQISARAIRAFIENRSATSLRTRQNDMAALRTILRVSGRAQFAHDAAISNKALGISGGSRRGTKTAFPDSALISLLARIEDAGLRAILQLERALGLRAKEAILSVRSLETWQEALLTGKREIHVLYGTKGGRQRWVEIVDRDATLAAVESALRVCRERGNLAPKSNLKSALKWYSNAMCRLGVQGHALRYTFIQCFVQAKLDQGHTLAEALALAAMAAGHGDGRGRMCKCVYGQGATFK